MPIYEYLCPNCKVKFELLRPLNQSSETASCPRCYSDAERMFSPFASFSKGTGGVSTPVGGGASCSTCSAVSCADCKG